MVQMNIEKRAHLISYATHLYRDYNKPDKYPYESSGIMEVTIGFFFTARPCCPGKCPSAVHAMSTPRTESKGETKRGA